VSEELLLISPTTDLTWQKDIVDDNAGAMVLVLFEADDIIPCEQLRTVIEKVADKHPEVHVFSYDVNAENAYAKTHDVKGVPTLMLFVNGTRVWSLPGHQPLATIERLLAKHLEVPA